LLKAHGIKIIMDGKGRCMYNIFIERLLRILKYEDVVCCERFVSA
jgi:putative transposase